VLHAAAARALLAQRPTYSINGDLFVQVAETHLHKHCDACGGTLRGTVDPAALTQRLTVYRNCGKYYGFALLEELAETVLSDGRVVT
jgi:hypothetical protein